MYFFGEMHSFLQTEIQRIGAIIIRHYAVFYMPLE